MDVRKAIGATVVTAVLFSALISSNTALYVTSVERAADSALASEASSLYSDALIAKAHSGLDLLASVQATASSSSYGCGDSTKDLMKTISQLSVVSRQGGMTAIAAVTGSARAEPDNLSLVRPFDGGLPGQLNLGVRISANGSLGGESLVYLKSELHTLHLPFNPERAGRLCSEITSSLRSAATQFSRSGCNSSSIMGVLGGLSRESESLAQSQKLLADVSLSEGDPLTCSVNVHIMVAEGGISGPYAPFTWRVQSEFQVSPES